MALTHEKFQGLAALYRHGDYENAASQVAAALRASPQDPNLLHLAAQVAEAQGQGARAALFYRRALKAHPGWIEARFNLALAMHALGETAEAIVLMSEVGRERPSLPQVWETLAKFCQASGDLSAAVPYWEKALALAPEQHEWRAQLLMLKRQMCAWGEEDTARGREFWGKLPPQAVTVFVDDPALQREAAERYARERFGRIQRGHERPRYHNARVRVGYLSSDFHAHATAYLLAELFELHDRETFEIFAYSYGVEDKSAIRARLAQSVEHFVALNKLSASKAAERIREDKIDILVDLKGHTRGGRLEILAYRPAPIQVHWLGYPGTLGADFIDCFVADHVTVPKDHEKFFAERILRLPCCYQINDRKRAIGERLTRADYGLPEEAFVLASFNQTYKITPEMFSLWCGILREAPQAVLWLYQSNARAAENLRREAERLGVDPGRIFFAEAAPLEAHLARYAHVDLALDTHPVGGHTTTSDALWAGAPVVTMIGKSFVARVAASILTAAEMASFVAATAADYKELVLKFARDPAALRGVKDKLKLGRDALPLFDTPRVVSAWEGLLVGIYGERM